MNSGTPIGSKTNRVLQSLSAAVSHLRRNLSATAKMAAVILIIFELGAIWNEVHHIRNEQVKNAFYALPKERRNALKGTPTGKHLQSTAFVDGDVSIDGAVQLNEPVEVEIDR